MALRQRAQGAGLLAQRRELDPNRGLAAAVDCPPLSVDLESALPEAVGPLGDGAFAIASAGHGSSSMAPPVMLYRCCTGAKPPAIRSAAW
jgi:hypothetical protein